MRSTATRPHRGRWIALMTATALLATACGRDGDDSADAEEEEPTTEEASGGESRLANGEFGDLGPVCGEGDGSGAGSEETGLTDDEINLGVITNKGADIVPGLNEEMYDTSAAFVRWCNEQGGINGRQIVLNDLDARTTEYGDRIEEACDSEFALVGGGAIFDDNDAGARVACDLISLPAFVVTPKARVAEQQVQPVPNPVYQFPAQVYARVREEHPDVTRVAVYTADLAGPRDVQEQVIETVEQLGFEVVISDFYDPLNETGWQGFVQDMRRQDVHLFELVGEPDRAIAMQNAMAAEGWYPEVTTYQPNMYDQKFEDEASGTASDATYLRSSFPLWDMADEFDGLADYFELMETHSSGGKYPALLGVQSLSAWLLFAQAATACDEEGDLTRTCVLERAEAIEEWTGGGAHAPTDPGNAIATTCGLIVQVTSDGFVYNEDMTNPTDGVFNCEDHNVVDLENDYGVPRPTA